MFRLRQIAERQRLDAPVPGYVYSLQTATSSRCGMPALAAQPPASRPYPVAEPVHAGEYLIDGGPLHSDYEAAHADVLEGLDVVGYLLRRTRERTATAV